MVSLRAEQMQREGLRRLQSTTIPHVLGVDEVGYGAWAGPVVVCATVVPKGWAVPGLRDSKKLSAARRSQLNSDLTTSGMLMHVILEFDNTVVDSLGVTKARDILVMRAVQRCLTEFPNAMVVMDGDHLPANLPGTAMCFPKADDLVQAVAAASVLAKVYRDGLMDTMHDQYPWYDFGSNMGYGTAAHQEGIEDHGLCAIHRRSYRNLAPFARRGWLVRRGVARLLEWQQSQNAMRG